MRITVMFIIYFFIDLRFLTKQIVLWQKYWDWIWELIVLGGH